MTKEKIDLLEIVRTIQDKLHLEGGNLEQNRRAFDEHGAQAALPSPCEITPVKLDDQLSGEWISAGKSGNNTPTALLYLHGGGFSVGSATSHRQLTAYISRAADSRVLSINYRLTPENRFPAALEDSVNAYRWLLEKGFAPEHIALAGDSAGGGLAMATVIALRQEGLPQPAGAVGISPWLDLLCSSDSHIRNRAHDPLADRDGLTFVARAYARQDEMTNPLISPFYASELTGLCPILLQVGTHETLLDETRAFAETARQSGVDATVQEWPEMIHVWHNLVGLVQDADDAIDAIGSWLQSRWK